MMSSTEGSAESAGKPAALGCAVFNHLDLWAWAMVVCAIHIGGWRSEAAVYEWASPSGPSGSLNQVSGLSNAVGIAAAGETTGGSMYLLADGTVVTRGGAKTGYTNVPPDLGQAIAISFGSGADHAMALRADGSVRVWGTGGPSGASVTNVPMGLSNVVAISGGSYHCLALKRDGTVVAWGAGGAGTNSYYDRYQSAVPLGLSNVVAIETGTYISAAVLADGRVVCWGPDWPEVTNVPLGLTNVVSVTVDDYDSKVLALRSDGTVVSLGLNTGGPGTGYPGPSNVVAVGVAYLGPLGPQILAILDDGKWESWNTLWVGQSPPFPPAQAISFAHHHGLVLQGEGEPYIGTRLADRFGQLGGRVFFRVEAVGQRPLHYQWTRNGMPVDGATNSVLSLNQLALADQGEYSVVVSNALGSVSIPPARLSVAAGPLGLPPTPMKISLDGDLEWSRTGIRGWISQNMVTHDGVDAGQSGLVGDRQESVLETTVTGPGVLTYWWRVSSEKDYDWLEFSIDGVMQNRISGENPWQQMSNMVSAGSHSLRWRYTKDESGLAGQDTGWLDEVLFTPAAMRLSGNLIPASGAESGIGIKLVEPRGSSVVWERMVELGNWVPFQTNQIGGNTLELQFPIRATNAFEAFRARSGP